MGVGVCVASPETFLSKRVKTRRIMNGTVTPSRKALHAYFLRKIVRNIPNLSCSNELLFRRIAGSTRESIPPKSCQAYLRFLAQSNGDSRPPCRPLCLIIWHYAHTKPVERDCESQNLVTSNSSVYFIFYFFILSPRVIFDGSHNLRAIFSLRVSVSKQIQIIIIKRWRIHRNIRRSRGRSRQIYLRWKCEIGRSKYCGRGISCESGENREPRGRLATVGGSVPSPSGMPYIIYICI